MVLEKTVQRGHSLPFREGLSEEATDQMSASKILTLGTDPQGHGVKSWGLWDVISLRAS